MSLEYIVQFTDEEAVRKFDKVHGTDGMLVRCRDCKYYAIDHLTKDYEPDKRFNPSVCINGQFARPRKPDWFCADGERRESDG